MRSDSLVIDSFGVALMVNAGFVTQTFVLPVSVAPRTIGGGSDETPGKTPGKTPDLILGWLAEAPPELAQQLGKTSIAHDPSR